MNFLNDELNELGLSVIIFKGFWGFFDNYLFIQFNDIDTSLAVLITSYIIYFSFCIYNLKNNSLLAFVNRKKYSINIVYFIAYLVLIGIWAPLWYLYDKIVLDDNSPRQLILLLCTHFFCAFVAMCFNLTSLLGGFGVVAEYSEDNMISEFFEIKYFVIY